MGLENLAVTMENLLAAWNDAAGKPEFLKSINSALRVYLSGTDIAQPEEWSSVDAEAIIAAATGSSYTTNQVTEYVSALLLVRSLTTDTLAVTGLFGPNMDRESSAIVPINMATGRLNGLAADGTGSATATISATGLYLFRIKAHKLKITKTGAIATAAITWMLSPVPMGG